MDGEEPRRIVVAQGDATPVGGDREAAALREPLLQTEQRTQEDDGEDAVVEEETSFSRKRALGIYARFGAPIIAMRMSTFLLFLMLHIFLGRLGVTQLSAGLLGFTVFRATVISVLLSMTSGLTTIGGQAFGAKEYSLVGILFQRSLVICALFMVPIVVIYTQSEWLLNHLGQPARLAEQAGLFLCLLSPSVMLLVPMICMQMYWMAQKVTIPATVTAGISLAVAPAVLWLFIFKFDWGVAGGALGLDAVIGFRVLVLMLWTILINWNKYRTGAEDLSWPGWSLQAFCHWGELIKLGVYTMMMMSVRGWEFDYFTLMSGILPDAEVAVSVFGISLYLFQVSMVIARALNVGLSFGVAHELGGGHAMQAKHMMQVGFCIIMGFALVYNSMLVASSHYIGYIWTHDHEVVSRLPRIMLIACVANIGQCMVSVFTGTLTGCRHQKEASRIVSMLHVFLGIPGPWLFSIYLKLGVLGLWLTRLIIVILEALFMGYIVWRLDWDHEVERAKDIVQSQKKRIEQSLRSVDQDDTGSEQEESEEASSETV